MIRNGALPFSDVLLTHDGATVVLTETRSTQAKVPANDPNAWNTFEVMN